MKPLLVSLLLFIAACARPAASAEPTPASHANIARIGAALSLTGSASFFGQEQRNAITLAQDEINSAHLLGQTRLEVSFADDASDREQAASAFQRLIDSDHVLAILGPTLSDAALGADPIAQQAGVPVVSISNAAAGITAIGNFIFRACLSETQLTPRIIQAVRAHVNLRSAALLYSDTDPNRSGSHGFKDGLQSAGVRIATEQTFSRDDTDFARQLEEIAATSPDAVFITAPASAASTILIQARQHGLAKTPIIGSSTFTSSAVLRNGGEAAEGLIVGSGWTRANPSIANQKFIQAYRTRFSTDPDQVAAQAYSGMYILAAALQNANSLSDSHSVRNALEQVHGLDTPLGLFSFDDARDPDYPPVVQVVNHGQFEPY
jgi:branched-chain amino acid transport system substrate-binding protein